MKLSGKRILITQPMMHWICGSTIVALELAEYLIKQGAKVTIYTCFSGDPIKSICKKKGVKVFDSESGVKYKLNDFDIIWIHSQILPLSLIEDLGKPLPKQIPLFVFLHMSGMDWIPDEKPWIYDLENKLSSKSLFICEEIEDINKSMLDKSVEVGYFRNLAPSKFRLRSKPPKERLKDLLIVSNHPPEELLAAKKILMKEYGIVVHSLGENQEKSVLFDNAILEKYDAVVTIAKTVVYCLVSGTPVYVYDAFSGGVGWLNSENFEKAEKRNFSGYQNKFYSDCIGGGFERKSATQIAKEIVSGYNEALIFQTKNQAVFQEKYLIDNVLPEILENLKPRNDLTPFSNKYMESILAAEKFAENRFRDGSTIHNLDEEKRHLIHRLSEMENLRGAKSYKLYKKMIVDPYKKIKRIKSWRFL